ncbi:hypothetical protein Vid5_gp08 [Pantoea phage vB_PagS_Vid5]|uniref:Uncharacterized protein n=1 Tax=Pantoea phage vB_PagS_Vid5 TaxID=2099652 RepID=A0A2P1CKI7_9CAUD|nr:hypothetical protein FDJ45_gp008 [Pantoea phage vB_PagS_Vid5]AVJ51763.1 hypothetical protein Vid5_gp08 [Pantoea phage vB_PagS_Vid5]
MEKQKILDALNKLDSANDNHWTADGKPKVDTVKFLAGGAVTREDIDAVAPDYNRENRVVTGEETTEQTDTAKPVDQAADSTATGSETAQQNQDASQAPPVETAEPVPTDGTPSPEVDPEALAATNERNEEIKQQIESGELTVDGEKPQPGDALNPTANSPVVGTEQLGVQEDNDQSKKIDAALDLAIKGFANATVDTETDVTTLSDEQLQELVDKHQSVMNAVNQLQENVRTSGRAKLAVIDAAIVEQQSRQGGNAKQNEAEQLRKFRETQAQLEPLAPSLRENYVHPVNDPNTRKIRR